MKKLLITDNSQFIKSDTLKYDKVLFIEKTEYKDSTIEEVNLPRYFMLSHKTARNINKILFNDSLLRKSLHLSLMKLSDHTIFESARVIEIIKALDSNTTIEIKTKHNEFLKYFFKILKIDTKYIKLLNMKKPFCINKKIYKYFFGSIILLFNYFRIKTKNKKHIFIMYNDKISFEFAQPYINDTLIYPFNTNSLTIIPSNYNINDYIKYKFIAPSIFLLGIKNYFNNKKKINKSNLPKVIKNIYIGKLISLEMQNMMMLSLKVKYKKLDTLLGLFDATSSIDYISSQLNSHQNITTICVPHGINFRYKVNYISYGVNKYTFWSKDHFNRLESSNILQNEKTEKIITGNIVYSNTLKNLQKQTTKNKNILVVGEYFSEDNYYSSAFNYNATKVFFDTISEFLMKNNDCKLTIRTRLSDGYFKLAQKYTSNNIIISSPSISIIEEINKNDLIISVFSNALHEALLLEKKVLQVNLLEIENYRDLAKDDLVYYADTKELLEKTLQDWYNDQLSDINYSKHLSKYCNNGQFKKLKCKDRM